MKFKAHLVLPDQLAKLLATMNRVADSCVVHLTPQLIQLQAAPVAGRLEEALSS